MNTCSDCARGLNASSQVSGAWSESSPCNRAIATQTEDGSPCMLAPVQATRERRSGEGPCEGSDTQAQARGMWTARATSMVEWECNGMSEKKRPSRCTGQSQHGRSLSQRILLSEVLGLFSQRSATLTTCLPKFSPLSIPTKALGALSIPLASSTR